jgi:hypothetical protein
VITSLTKPSNKLANQRNDIARHTTYTSACLLQHTLQHFYKHTYSHVYSHIDQFIRTINHQSPTRNHHAFTSQIMNAYMFIIWTEYFNNYPKMNLLRCTTCITNLLDHSMCLLEIVRTTNTVHVGNSVCKHESTQINYQAKS